MEDGEQSAQPRGRAFTRRHLIVTVAGVLCLIAGAVLAGFEGGVVVDIAEVGLRIFGLMLTTIAVGLAVRSWREARRPD